MIKTIEMNEEALLKVTDVAEFLGISKNNVYNLIYSGILPAIKIGGYKVRKTTLLKFLSDYEGYDLSDLENVRKIELKTAS